MEPNCERSSHWNSGLTRASFLVLFSLLFFLARYGDEIARLRVAQSNLRKALDASKTGVSPVVISDLMVRSELKTS